MPRLEPGARVNTPITPAPTMRIRISRLFSAVGPRYSTICRLPSIPEPPSLERSSWATLGGVTRLPKIGVPTVHRVGLGLMLGLYVPDLVCGLMSCASMTNACTLVWGDPSLAV